MELGILSSQQVSEQVKGKLGSEGRVDSNEILVSQPEKLNSTFKMVKVVENKKLSSLGLIVISKKKDLIIVAFRGTVITKWQNIKTDLGIKHASYNITGCRACRVHTGFYKSFNSIVGELDRVLAGVVSANPKANIVVTGHSLGGALATLMANHVAQKYGKKYYGRIELVSFGSPRVGNKALAEYSNKLLGLSSIFRVSYKYDPVTYLPLKLMGYMHVGNEKYVYSNWNKFKVVVGKDIESINPLAVSLIKNHREYTNISKLIKAQA